MLESEQQRNSIEREFAGCSVFLFAGVLVGSSWTYGFHGIVFLMACFLLVKSSDWRSRTLRYFTEAKRFWVGLGIFASLFVIPFSFSSYSRFSDVSELKWILVFLGLLMPAAAIYRSGGKTKLVRVIGSVVFALLILSAIGGTLQALTERNFLRELIGATIDSFGNPRRASGILRNPIPFGQSMGALFWISASGVLISWMIGRKGLCCLCALASLGAFAGVLFSQTRGAWLAVAVVSVVSILVLWGRARRFWLSCLGIVFAAGVLGLIVSSETRERLVSAFDASETSNRFRLELWQGNFEILKDHPFGIGYNANDQLIEEAFEELGFETHPYMGHSHNEFVEIAVGSGWLGIGMLLGLTFWVLWKTVSHFRRVSLEDEPWTAFLLLSSILIQLFVSACALTDQFSTPGRFLLSYAWAFAIVVPVERAVAKG